MDALTCCSVERARAGEIHGGFSHEDPFQTESWMNGAGEMGAKLLMGRFHPLKCCDGAFWSENSGEEQLEWAAGVRDSLLFCFCFPQRQEGEKTVLVFVASLSD